VNGAAGQFKVTIVDRPVESVPPIAADDRCGAVVTFQGVVRAQPAREPVVAIEYECYRELAEREIRSILDEVQARYDVRSACVVHRVGRVAAGESSVRVSVATPHRQEAFDAIRYIVNALKERAPIWKKELYADGTSRWL
jgi:molybdopterin synthase catalytic subunit